MGTCGASKERKKDNKATTEPNESKKPEENIKLKGQKKVLKEKPIEQQPAPATIVKNPSTFSLRIKDIVANQIYQQEYEGTKTLNEILKSLKINLSGDFDLNIETGTTFQLNEELNTNLIELFTRVYNKKIPEQIEISYKYKGLNIPTDVIKAYIDSNPIIGSPILDNQEAFGIITFDKNTKSIDSHYFSSQENENLSKFNSFTAYCNAFGFLYLSGGEKEQFEDPDTTVFKYNDFFSINLQDLNEQNGRLNIKELPNLNISRTWHSMIFVPNNYIFIVGGSNTNVVEVYDINTNELTKDSELLEIRGECTLCLANDTFLYAFCGFALHRDYIYSIEKCNLRCEKRKWESVGVEGDKIKPSFFGVSYYCEDQLLLVGANDNSDNNSSTYNYLVKFGGDNDPNDQLKEFSIRNNPSCVYREKLFIPIDEDKAVNIPLIVGEEVKVFILDMKTGDIEIQYKKED